MAESRVSGWLNGLRRPAVIAHRGASAAAAENSLGALRRAVELGADGVEFDVQRCGTGELVVFHDRTLARCTGALGSIGETSLERLRTLRLDRVASARGLPAGEGIPTLAEWLEAAPPGLFLNLEAKVDTITEAAVGAEAARALAGAGRLGNAVLSSFHPLAVRRAALAEPGLPCGALVEDGAGWEWRLGLGLSFARDTVHPPWSLVTPGRVAGWKRGGRRVLVWTVDDPEVAARCLDAGVDGLITNVPDRIRPVCERHAR